MNEITLSLCMVLVLPAARKKGKSMGNLKEYSREITLDALCVTQDGRYCNVEVQKENSNDDIRRTRFHASALTAKYTPNICKHLC